MHNPLIEALGALASAASKQASLANAGHAVDLSEVSAAYSAVNYAAAYGEPEENNDDE